VGATQVLLAVGIAMRLF